MTIMEKGEITLDKEKLEELLPPGFTVFIYDYVKTVTPDEYKAIVQNIQLVTHLYWTSPEKMCEHIEPYKELCNRYFFDARVCEPNDTKQVLIDLIPPI